MRIEREYGRNPSVFDRCFHDTAEQSTMTGMDAIEIADGYSSRSCVRTDLSQAAEDPKHSASVSNRDSQAVERKPHTFRKIPFGFFMRQIMADVREKRPSG